MHDTIGTLLYGLHVIVHPFDGFWELKYHRRHTRQAATVILLLTLLTTFVQMQMSGFLFGSFVPEDNNVLMGFVGVLAPLAMWIVVNWSITTLFDGKGKMDEIYIYTCFALLPMVLINLPLTLITHFLTLDEAVFFYVGEVVVGIWCVWLILSGSVVIHEYSMFKSIVTGLCTLLGIAAAAFLLMVIYSAISQLINFFVTLVMEITYW